MTLQLGGSTEPAGYRRGVVASTAALAALLAERLRISSRAARCTDRFAKPSVMQGVPLPTRGYSCTAAPEGKVERGAVVRPRAPPLHAPRTPVKCLLVSCQCRF